MNCIMPNCNAAQSGGEHTQKPTGAKLLFKTRRPHTYPYK